LRFPNICKTAPKLSRECHSRTSPVRRPLEPREPLRPLRLPLGDTEGIESILQECVIFLPWIRFRAKIKRENRLLKVRRRTGDPRPIFSQQLELPVTCVACDHRAARAFGWSTLRDDMECWLITPRTRVLPSLTLPLSIFMPRSIRTSFQ